MPKISQLPSDSSPQGTDYLSGVQQSGTVTKSFSLNALLTWLFNNVPNNKIKSPALALSNALDGTNGVQSFSNGGTAGGTGYYINLGGIKIIWGTTNNLTQAANSTTSYSVTLPAGFLSTLQFSTFQITQADASVDQNKIIGNIQSASSLQFYMVNDTALPGVGGFVSYIAIGT